MKNATPSVALEGAFDALLSLLAARLAPMVAAHLVQPSRYADKDSNPYGSGRAFLDAARRGDFPTFRRARKVTARWEEVETALEKRRPARAQACLPGPIDPDRAELESAGVRLRPANDAGHTRRRGGPR